VTDPQSRADPQTRAGEQTPFPGALSSSARSHDPPASTRDARPPRVLAERLHSPASVPLQLHTIWKRGRLKKKKNASRTTKVTY